MSMGGCISAPRRARALLSRGWRTQCFILAAALTAGSAFGQGLREIRDIRFWSVGEVTRVAVELSGEFRFSSQRLANPDRVFFDIENTTHSMGRGVHNIAVGDNLLEQIRVAETRPGVTRIVFDLATNAEFESSQLSAPARLMIEFRPRGSQPSVSSTGSAVGTGGAQIAAIPESDVPTAAVPRGPAPVATQPSVPAGETTTTAASVASSSPAVPPVPPPAPPPAPMIDTSGMPAPRAAERNSNGDRSLTRVLGLKIGRVVLDAGHGGNDPGTHGASGIVEKELTLDITKRLKKLIEDELGAEVILTRSDDRYVSLGERTRIANQSQADLFLSIHANSSPVKSVAGIDTYFLNFSASRADLDVATRENASADSTIYDLKEIVSQIALRAKIDESRELAARLQEPLFRMAKAQNDAAKDRGIKRAPFQVLIGTDMPSVLTEIGFLSNDRDEALLRTSEHRDRIARALMDGIQSYLSSLSEMPLALLE